MVSVNHAHYAMTFAIEASQPREKASVRVDRCPCFIGRAVAASSLKTPPEDTSDQRALPVRGRKAARYSRGLRAERMEGDDDGRLSISSERRLRIAGAHKLTQ